MSVATGFTPDLKIAEDSAALAALSSSFVTAALERAPSPLAVLPTGRTPLGLYETLVERSGQHSDLWRRMRFLQLDEYAGLRPDDPRLFASWLARVFLDKVGVPEGQRMLFQSTAPEPIAECERIENWLTENGPIDLAVLGLGINGHLGMNEPGTPFGQPTHHIRLTPDTIRAGAAYWGSEDAVPREGYTLGLRTLMQAREILLLVSGESKAAILERVLTAPIAPDLPATILRTHPKVTILADRAAAGPMTPHPAFIF